MTQVAAPAALVAQPVLRGLVRSSLDRVAMLAATAVAGALVPWTVHLARGAGAHSLLWVGVDLAECVTAGAVAVLVARGSRLAPTAARVLTLLLAADATVDVLIADSWGARLMASGLALGVELPLAAAAWWWANRSSVSGSPVQAVSLGGPRRAAARRAVRRAPRHTSR